MRRWAFALLGVAVLSAGCNGGGQHAGTAVRAPTRDASSSSRPSRQSAAPSTPPPRRPAPPPLTPGPVQPTSYPRGRFVPTAASFVAPTRGWVLGQRGCADCRAVFETADAGRTWTLRSRPDLPWRVDTMGSRRLLGQPQLYFANRRDGFIYSAARCRHDAACGLLVTHDAGRSWAVVPLPPIGEIWSGGGEVYALDRAARPMQLWRSPVGTDRWIQDALPPFDSARGVTVTAQGNTLVLVESGSLGQQAGDPGEVRVSTDRGRTWTRRPVPCPATSFGSVVAVDIDRGRVGSWLLECYANLGAGQQGATEHHLYLSSDGGRHWRRLADPSDYGGTDDMADDVPDGLLFVTGLDQSLGTVYRSATGNHWHVVLRRHCLGWESLRRLAGRTAYLTELTNSGAARVYRSGDDGRTWRQLLLPTRA